MLTDIFAYRYLDQPIWSNYTEIEQRLLNQAFGIVKDALPYYTWEGKVNEINKDKWKLLHDTLAHELGVNELSTRYYSYTQTNSLGDEIACIRLVFLGSCVCPVCQCKVHGAM